MWNLFAVGKQIMRAADCKNLSESPKGDFRQSKQRSQTGCAAFVLFVLREGVLGLVPGEPFGEGGAFLKLTGFEGV